MGTRILAHFLSVFIVAGCASGGLRHERFIETQDTSPECVRLRTFLEQDFHNFHLRVEAERKKWESERATFLGTSSGDIERALAAYETWQSRLADETFWSVLSDQAVRVAAASSQRCREIERVRHLSRVLSLSRIPSVEASADALEAMRLELQFEARNRRHVFRLPGEGGPVDRLGYLERLARTAEVQQRERLFKLFNSSRALRWGSWGFRDLVLARNRVARRLGRPDFAVLMLERAGTSLSETSALLEDIRVRVVPELQSRLGTLTEPGPVQPVQAWDVAWLNRMLLPSLSPEQTESEVFEVFLKGLGETTLEVTSEVAAASRSWTGVRDRVALWSAAKEPDVPFLLSDAALGFAIQTLYDRLLHTMSFQTLLARGPASSELERSSLVASIEIVQRAMKLDFEINLYRESERDPAELWASIWALYWGTRPESFYSGWDIDSYLVQPFQTLAEVRGTALADLWLANLGEVFPELWGNQGLALRLQDRFTWARRGATAEELTRALIGRAPDLRRYP